MSNRLPTRLLKEPVIEAIFELRFSSTVPVSTILSGALYASLKCDTIERLPHAEIPDVIRKSDPNLRYAPLVKLGWTNFSIVIGDSSIAMSSGNPYPGWAKFKDGILSTLKAVAEVERGTIGAIERYSLKYSDVLENSIFSGRNDHLKINLSFGENQLVQATTHARSEVHEPPFIHIIDFFGQAGVTLPSGANREGSLLTTDSIYMAESPALSELMTSIPENLDKLHSRNKEIFFSCLTQAGIDLLEPQYD